MTRNFSLGLLAAGACCLALAGCGDESSRKSPGKTAAAKTGDGKTADGDQQLAKTSDGTATDTHVVTLGVDDLTSGIPGQGPLTNEQIQAWLNDPRQHETLEVKLPLGLDAGAGVLKNSRELSDNPLTRAKIELGRQLYFDKRLSKDGTISCASCHDAAQGYAAATQFGVGVNGQQGGRNSPVSYNRILSTSQFWDGRAASLEEQAKGPIANPIEMANTHEAAVKTVQEIPGYVMQFQSVFAADVTIDGIAQAIASFERAIVTGPSAYDYFERLEQLEKQRGDDLKDLEALRKEEPELAARYEMLKAGAASKPISNSAKRGRNLFFGQKANCTACHVGANFSDEKYHNLGVGMEKPDPDQGRYAIVAAKHDEKAKPDEKERGAFKTPTVRNVALSAPYMHDGSQKTLEEVVEWYDKGGHPNPQLSDKIKKLNLTKEEKADLVEFMKALTGDFPKVETERLPLK